MGRAAAHSARPAKTVMKPILQGPTPVGASVSKSVNSLHRGLRDRKLSLS